MPPIEPRADAPEAFRPLIDRLRAHAGEPSRARQMTHAVLDDLCDRLGLTRPAVVFASDLIGSPAGASLVGALRDDLDAAVRAYNGAIERLPNTGVRPMSIGPDRVELPLWTIAPGRRAPVTVRRDAPLDDDHLAPRGLLMTAIVRLTLCDAFIHGTGGLKYDRVTEAWIGDWLGSELAPMVGASATLRLDLPLPESFTDPDRASWEAHHARHDPDMLDEHARARRKDELVRTIDAMKARGDDPSGPFDELQSLLDRTRRDHGPELEDLRERAAWAQRFRAMRDIAADRTWAYPLHDHGALIALRDAVRERMG